MITDDNETYHLHQMKMRYQYLQRHQNEYPELYDKEDKITKIHRVDLPVMEEEETHQVIAIRTTTTTLKDSIMEA
jgi:hypothetical protein